MAHGGRMETVAEGVYRRNGRYLVAIWNPAKGKAGGKEWHTLGPKCACGTVHPGSTLAQAKALRRALETVKANGRRSSGETTVAEFVGYYDADAWVPGRWLELKPRKAESTNIHNDGRVRPFARAFAGRSLASVSEEEAAEFAIDFPGSFKEVHAMFNDACSLRKVPHNPFAGVRVRAREGRRGITVLTDAELGQLLGIARAVHGSYGPLFAAMIQTSAWTGLRPGELFVLSLEPGDFLNFADLRNGVISVDWALNAKTGKVGRPKNSQAREVALLPGAEDALRSVREWEAGKPVFLTKRGKPFNQRTFFYYWNPVRAAFVAALPAGHHLRTRLTADGEASNLDFYELRHFFGTKLAHPPEGVAPARPQDIAEMMGHQDGGELAMRIYVHTENEDARRRIRAAWRQAS